jgi:capsular exopolysaccharide synthesis family protein
VKDRSKSALVVSEGDQSFIAEQFRQLRTTLSFLGINSKKKKILVTSSIASEGKTFISANLGISLALAHHKVALLEMDLRRPALASLFGIDGSEGISQYLNGDKDIEHIIKRCEGYKNLFIIPSGPIPPNPSELLLGGRLAELFRFLEDGFDYLIIDTTPVSPVTDAYILSPLCDATLYVMRQGVTPRAIVQNLDQYKGVRSLKNMAIVFNGVNGRDFGEYGYRQGYSYVREKAGKRKKHKAAL